MCLHAKQQRAEFLREAKTTSYGIENGAAKTAWYSTASCTPGFVGLCHTTFGGRYIPHRLSCRVPHCLMSADSEADTTVPVAIFVQRTRGGAPEPVTDVLAHVTYIHYVTVT